MDFGQEDKQPLERAIGEQDAEQANGMGCHGTPA